MTFSQGSLKTVRKHNYLQSYHSKITVMILWSEPPALGRLRTTDFDALVWALLLGRPVG